MKRYKIAVIPGDGIGQEVIPEGVKILEEIAGKYNVEFEWEEFDWSCQYYAENGTMMPEDGLEQISSHNAIFLGAVGYPGVPDHISLWGLLIPIRRSFNQYVNVRPVRLMEGLDCPLKNKVPQDIDMVIVRENNEGEYSEIGGKIYANTSQEMVIQESVFTQKGVDRILKYAFELAGTRRGKVTSATKSNGIIHTMPYWDSRFEMIKKGYPHVTTDEFHIDILTAHFVLHPEWFDVVVAV